MVINPAERNENIKKLRELIKDIRIAMLTTVDTDGRTLRSRPMATQRVEFNGDLWFFTRAAATEIGNVIPVNVTFANSDKALYISISGTGTIIRDLDRMEDLWQPRLKAWFPMGLDDPNLALIKVEVENAEFWDGPDNVVQELISVVRSFAAGERFEAGANERFSFR